jgi:hypothetical protein
VESNRLRHHKNVEFVTHGATVAPVNVPKNPFNKIPIPCHPIPRLITNGGGGVAPDSLATAKNPPVDCNLHADRSKSRP